MKLLLRTDLPVAAVRLSVICGPAVRISQVRYVLPRHKAANWVGRGGDADAEQLRIGLGEFGNVGGDRSVTEVGVLRMERVQQGLDG